MGEFYKPSSYRAFKRFLKKKGFVIRESGGHMIATLPGNEAMELAIPRHKTLSNGLTESQCKKLVELGFEKAEIKRAILR